MVREATVAHQCADFEREICLSGGFNHSTVQKSLSILGKAALREINEYLQTRRPFDNETIEERVQNSWCTLLSEIQR